MISVKPEVCVDLIDFMRIDQVNYIRNKHKGRAFEISFNQKVENEPMNSFLKGDLHTFVFSGFSQQNARKWVKSIITAVEIYKSRQLHAKRESQKNIIQRETRRSKHISPRHERRKTLTQFISSLMPDSYKESSKESSVSLRSHSAGKNADGPVMNISIPITQKQEDVWKLMMNPVSPKNSNLTNQLGSTRRRNVFTHDRDALLGLIETSSGNSTPKSRRSPRVAGGSGTKKKRQIILSPFKQILWDFIMVFCRRYSKSIQDYEKVNLRERSILAIQNIGQGNCMLNYVMKKKDLVMWEESLFNDDSASDKESPRISETGLPPSEEKLCADQFELIVSLKPSASTVAELSFFWICEMQKPESNGGVSRKEKHCSVVTKNNEIKGLKWGMAWNPKFPTFKGADAIDWWINQNPKADSSDAIIFLQSAIDRNYMAAVVSDEDSIDVSKFEAQSMYYFTADINGDLEKNDESMEHKEDGGVQPGLTEEITLAESKEVPSDDDSSISNPRRKKSVIEDKGSDDSNTYEILAPIISSDVFLDFFCSLPDDGAILRCILTEIHSDMRTSPSKLLSSLNFFSFLRLLPNRKSAKAVGRIFCTIRHCSNDKSENSPTSSI